ncbi:hypothetical protein ABW19_dt0206107 [Dactylella cylindrospora]|nr:hypothetical protein ABW19_dt0206107 [Dactylella cylindrospora]
MLPRAFHVALISIICLKSQPTEAQTTTSIDSDTAVFNATGENTFLGPDFTNDHIPRNWTSNVGVRYRSGDGNPYYEALMWIETPEDTPVEGPNVNRSIWAVGTRTYGKGPQQLDYDDGHNGCGFLGDACISALVEIIRNKCTVSDETGLISCADPYWGTITIEEFCSRNGEEIIQPFNVIKSLVPPSPYSSESELHGNGTARGSLDWSSLGYVKNEENVPLDQIYDEVSSVSFVWFLLTGPPLLNNQTGDAEAYEREQSQIAYPFKLNITTFCIKADTATEGSRAPPGSSGVILRPSIAGSVASMVVLFAISSFLF